MNKEIHARLERLERLLGDIKASARKPFDLDEAAAYLHQSKSHLYQLTSGGLIAHYKPNGKKIYFLKQDLDAYVLRNRRASAAELEQVAASHTANHPVAETRRGVGGGR